jgi:hypothetical protein
MSKSPYKGSEFPTLLWPIFMRLTSRGVVDRVIAGNSPTDLEATHEVEALKRKLAEQRRQVELELKLLDLALANIFDFLEEMEGKDDTAVACALARENVAMLVETAIQKLTGRGGIRCNQTRYE